MNPAIAIALAGWAAISCCAAFVVMVPTEAVTAVATEESRTKTDPITVAVSDERSVRYLTFRLRFTPDPDHLRTVPIEAAVKDILIEALAAAPDIAFPDGWAQTVAAILRERTEGLGVTSLAVIDTEHAMVAN